MLSVTRTANRPWTTELETRTIEFYRDNAHLWNPNHPDYYKRPLRQYKMELLAELLGAEHFPVQSIKDKWHSLVTSYSREEAKIKRLMENGVVGESLHHASNFKHYERMSFLRNKEPRHRIDRDDASSQPGDMFIVWDEKSDQGSGFTVGQAELAIETEPTLDSGGNITPTNCESESGNESREETSAQEQAFSSIHLPQLNMPSTMPSFQRYETSCIPVKGGNSLKRKSNAVSDYSLLSKSLYNPRNECSTSQSSYVSKKVPDPDELFTQYLMSQLKELSPYSKDKVKIEIQHLLLQHKYGEDNGSPTQARHDDLSRKDRISPGLDFAQIKRTKEELK